MIVQNYKLNLHSITFSTKQLDRMFFKVNYIMIVKDNFFYVIVLLQVCYLIRVFIDIFIEEGLLTMGHFIFFLFHRIHPYAASV